MTCLLVCNHGFFILKKNPFDDHFQQNDGIPVHFKRGARDKILFGITLALIGVGLAGCAEFVYSLP